MHPLSKLLLLLLLLPMIIILSISSVDGQYPLCIDYGNFTINGTFHTNLDALLNSITMTSFSTRTNRLFKTSKILQRNNEPIEVIGYCRGDVAPDACWACLNSSAYQVRQQCPFQKRAVFFDDKCTLKYSNGSLYGVLDTSSYFQAWNKMNVSNWDAFSAALKSFLDDLRGQAASGGPLQKYAQRGNLSVDLYTLYATEQCSPDLSDQLCRDCLIDITGRLPRGKIGARMLAPSCQLRYETYSFFDPIAVTVSSPSPATVTKAGPPSPVPQVELRKKKSSKTWIIIATSIASAVLLVVIVAFLLSGERKRRDGQVQRYEDAEGVIKAESLQFNLDTIRDATENFSDTKKLGQGGFGSVFRGKLPNGQEIAVKRLAKNSRQGELEFKNEVVLLAKLQHRNLVRLLGFCFEGDERLLIYELVPNSSLNKFIFDPIKRASLDWETRYKIIVGIARGILYLHEDSRLRIIHRDLKASNILLDTDMNPQVSDFGMARLFELDQTQSDGNRIVGTYGYMPPEYILHGHFSVKSDVFSFGVLVLEIVSGRKNLQTHHEEDSEAEAEILITHVWRSWREGMISNIVDPLVSSGYSADILRCIQIGLLCVQENVTNRPTMASVSLMLNSHSVILPVPTKAAFLTSLSYARAISPMLNITSQASKSDNAGNSMCTYSVNEVSVTDPYPR